MAPLAGGLRHMTFRIISIYGLKRQPALWPLRKGYLPSPCHFPVTFCVLTTMRQWMLCFCFCLVLLGLEAQQQGSTWPPDEVVWRGQALSEALTLERRLQRTRTPAEGRALLDRWVSRQKKDGHAEAQLSTFRPVGDTLYLQLWRGPRYYFAALDLPGLPEEYRARYRFDDLARKQAPLAWTDLHERFNAVLDDYQNDGYPFARFTQQRVVYQSPDSFGVGVRVNYAFDPGEFTVVDTIIFKGNPRERPAFIFNLTRLRPGDPYQQQLIADLPRVLNNSIYYERVEAPQVTFLPYRGAQVEVKLNKTQAGRFNLLLGILPPNDESQRLQFTGVVDILLVSPLRLGEVLLLEYNRLPSTSQRMNLELKLPYLLRTPVRAEGRFALLKQEEDFLNLEYRAALEYGFSPNLAASFLVNGRASRLLDSTLRDTSNLTPDQLDGNRQLLGLGLSYQRLDYRFNPSRGLDAYLELGLGQRRIRRNARLDEQIYADLDLEQPVQEVELMVKGYLPLAPRHVLHLANHSYWLGLDQYLRNDQRQIGGARSLRGFNENQFFTDLMSFFTFEYRFQLERDSYLFGFFDAAYLRDRVRDTEQLPLGTGIGMNYGTRAGILSVVYAVGRTADIPFQPARGRIHVGLINRF